MSVEDEWKIVRPMQRVKTEVIFCRDEPENFLPPKIESPIEILDSPDSDAEEPRYDLSWLYKPYLPRPRAIAPDRDSSLSYPSTGDCLSNVSDRFRPNSLQEDKLREPEESWNLLTRVKNWMFRDYDPLVKEDDSATGSDMVYDVNISAQENMAGTFPPDIAESLNSETHEYARFHSSQNASICHGNAQVSYTGNPSFRDLEASIQGTSFFDYSSDEDLDASFHTARDESRDSINVAILLGRLSDHETLSEDNEAGKLETEPGNSMGKGLRGCSFYDFSGKLHEGRESFLAGDEDETRSPSPDELRVNKPDSRPILDRDCLGTSLYYDLFEEQGSKKHVEGEPTCEIRNTKGAQEK
ncbi:unnamed protein product [Clonostachys rosea]|uniref:AGC-kinase C-terminal domain-containing protein n=1 Tax=Bionectria ochroleuca TaxID=29856 RepID=A0ABY6UZ86_BIOOC|nr:unnamed protein product [Clonostachys rosea]